MGSNSFISGSPKVQLVHFRLAEGLRVPYILGDTAVLGKLFSSAGLDEITITTQIGQARFPSIRSWVFTDIKGWTLADMIDDVQFQTLLEAAEQEMLPFVTAENNVAFTTPAHIVTYTKKLAQT